jgi:uncharacterized protein (DUF1684 family)
MSLELLDWRRSVAALYRDVRDGAERDPEGTLARFRAAKDELFRSHPQSPLAPEARAGFAGLRYWPYRADLRFEVEMTPGTDGAIDPVTPIDPVMPTGPVTPTDPVTPPGPATAPGPALGSRLVMARSLGGEAFPLQPLGRLRTPIGDLTAYWLAVYGGGVFVAFRDATSGVSTYGGGRYLLDTIKGADLGGHGSRLVLDFNYAYHPSCAYDPRWSCPLPRDGDRSAVPVEAGERLADMG